MICPKAVVYTNPVTPSVEHAEEYGDSFDAGKGTSSRRNLWTGKNAATPETNSHPRAACIRRNASMASCNNRTRQAFALSVL